MTVPKQLRAALGIPVDPPRPLISNDPWLSSDLLATGVQWERIVTDGRDLTRASIFTEEGRYCTYYPPFDTLPDWVPQPPASWDAIVSELAAEVLAR